jgi:hypothetical protein
VGNLPINYSTDESIKGVFHCVGKGEKDLWGIGGGKRDREWEREKGERGGR